LRAAATTLLLQQLYYVIQRLHKSGSCTEPVIQCQKLQMMKMMMNLNVT